MSWVRILKKIYFESCITRLLLSPPFSKIMENFLRKKYGLGTHSVIIKVVYLKDDSGIPVAIKRNNVMKMFKARPCIIAESIDGSKEILVKYCYGINAPPELSILFEEIMEACSFDADVFMNYISEHPDKAYF